MPELRFVLTQAEKPTRTGEKTRQFGTEKAFLLAHRLGLCAEFKASHQVLKTIRGKHETDPAANKYGFHQSEWRWKKL
jgi:hypothetical protein